MSFYLLVITVLISAVTTIKLNPLSDEFIHHINANQTLWTAGRNFHRDRPLIYFKRLMGSLRDIGVEYLPQLKPRNIKLARNFDGRKRWKNCPTLRQIRDQGSCGSCWAVSAVSAMTDRICINSNGQRNFYFSEDDVLSCCKNCGPGCDGGLLSKAWNYTFSEGTVSGGTFHSRQGCRPYEIPPCEHDVPGYRPRCGHVKKPECMEVCQSSYMKTYKDDKTKIALVYKVIGKRGMRYDIFKNGPVTTSMKVYEDFLHYKSGVYRHVSGDSLGDHAIKILGWGVEKGIKYWLAANSWNTDWGDNGFFKILRGENHCNVEEYALTGLFN